MPPRSRHGTYTPLKSSSKGAKHRYHAESYHELVDSPMLLGNPTGHEFEVNGIPHWLVNIGEHPDWGA